MAPTIRSPIQWSERCENKPPVSRFLSFHCAARDKVGMSHTHTQTTLLPFKCALLLVWCVALKQTPAHVTEKQSKTSESLSGPFTSLDQLRRGLVEAGGSPPRSESPISAGISIASFVSLEFGVETLQTQNRNPKNKKTKTNPASLAN